MNRSNQHAEQYRQQRSQTRAEKLANKYKVKTFAQEWLPMYYAGIGGAAIFQVLSLLTAVTLPAYWIKTVTNSWPAGFIVAGIVLGLLEFAKRSVTHRGIKNGLQYEKWLSFSMFFALIFSVLSIASSTIGTPVLIENFGATPTLQDTSGMNAAYMASVSKTTAYWSGQKSEAEAKAEATHKANSWKGRTTRSARPVVLGFQNAAKAAQDSLNKSLASLHAAHTSALISIDKANSEIVAQDKKKKASVGYILGFVTFGLELLFLLCTFWCEYFDYREALENKNREAKTNSNSGQKQDNSTDKQDDSKSNSKKESKNAIGFSMPTEGHILNKTIAYKKGDGTLKYYKSYQLTSMITDAKRKGKEEQVRRLTGLKQKLVNQK